MKHTSNCVNKCSNVCRLKTVSVSDFKLESGEVGWSNKVDGTEGCWNGCSIGMLMISGGSRFQALITLW